MLKNKDILRDIHFPIVYFDENILNKKILHYKNISKNIKILVDVGSKEMDIIKSRFD